MAFLKPIVTYAIAFLLVLWVLLGAITLPNAGRWLKRSDYSIQEDAISFKLNNGSISMDNAVTEKYGDKDFRSNVYAIDNTPNVPRDGLKGVLYDRGDSCTKVDPTTIPIPNFMNQNHTISKIALIRQSANCLLVDKILNAQLDGANGAIVFHNLSVTDDPSAKHYGMGVMPNSVNIPAYYIDLNAGLMLWKDLEDLFKTNGSKSEDHSEMMTRITLSPSNKPVLNHWQFALIIVGIMLVTSIIALSALQCHMWRMTRSSTNNMMNDENEILTADEQRQLTMEENFWRGIIGQLPRPLVSQVKRRKQRLDQEVVNLLPTRVYKVKEKEGNIMSVDSFDTACELSSCVICLDNFASGEILRRLPCNHEYHRDCIDVWLTKKSASCPLCQQIIQIPTVPVEIHARSEEESIMYEDMPDLAATWSGMARDEQIAMRQSPWASRRNRQQQTQQLESPTTFNPYPPM